MLHIIYRSYGGENQKKRPDYYSKLSSLASMVCSANQIAEGDVEIIYMNDGPIPDDRMQVMRSSGEILSYPEPVGLQTSQRAALNLPKDRQWADEDLVWFAEDDYLYQRRALSDLVTAAEMFPEADYFGLYAQIGNRQPNGEPSEDSRNPAHSRSAEPTLVAGHPWRCALSTTMTFGARVKSLNEDAFLMSASMRFGGTFDHAMSLAYQGFSPYPLWFLLASVRSAKGAKRKLWSAVVATVRLGFNAYVIARKLRGTPPRLLVAADPALITHMESAYMAEGTDWRAVWREAQDWIESQGPAAAATSLA